MAIVINDFEAVAEAPASAAHNRESAESERESTPASIAPGDIAPTLHDLRTQSLRAWAH